MSQWLLGLLAWICEVLEGRLLPRDVLLRDIRPHHGNVAVVALGYRLLESSCKPSHLLVQRIAVASELAKTALPIFRRTLVFSGGVGLGLNCSEAAAMFVHYQCCSHLPMWARIMQPRIQLETHSHSTYENALFTVQLLAEYDPSVRTLVVVTNRFHQRRACATFKHVAIGTTLKIECAQMPPSVWAPEIGLGHGSPAVSDWRAVDLLLELLWLIAREYLAIAWYCVNYNVNVS